MELPVRSLPILHIIGLVAAARNLSGLLYNFARYAWHCVAQRKGFEAGTHFSDLSQFSNVKIRDPDTASWQIFGEALRFQLSKSLTDWHMAC